MRPPRIRPLAGAALVATIAGCAILPIAAPASAQPQQPAEAVSAADTGSRFTLAVLPDTQFYSRYAYDQFEPRYGSNPFQVQTEWLADHSDELNIPFVAHLGDVVDRVGVASEWRAADAAMGVLDDAQLPYSILPGNHDVLNSNDQVVDTDYDLANEPYLQTFTKERIEGQPTEGGTDATGLNQFQVFEAEGQEYLMLALTWRASDATIAWAQGVIDAHAGLPTILTTHSLLAIESDQTTPLRTPYGEQLWESLIRGNDQIFLTLNGHSHGATREVRLNDAGHEVTQVLMDYQMAYDGGNGYLGLLEFDLDADRIDVQTASPWVVRKEAEQLTTYDQPFLEGQHQQFSIPLDFDERFPGFTRVEGTQPDLGQAARDILLDGFTGLDPITTAQPGSTEDYIRTAGTLAHWRPGAAGDLAEGGVVPDVAGGSDLVRAGSGAPVTVTADAHAFSAAGAATCFTGGDGTGYLTTAADAAINDADLSDGYTLESFVQLDAGWDASADGWSKFLVRSGNRTGFPEFPLGQWDNTASPTALGVSNLREFQYSTLVDDVARGDQTAWSGEIMAGTWLHVAIVNDAEAGTITMFVDGAPVLRNVAASDGIAGMAEQGLPWVIGTDWVDDTAKNGWNGCVGETRVIDRATTPDEWLTARPAVDGVQLITERLTVGDDPVLTGTGTPGATVTLGGDLAGSAVVGENGAWSLEAATAATASPAGVIARAAATAEPALRAGTYAVTLTQAFGARAGTPVDATVTVVAADVTDPGTAPGQGGTGEGDGSSDGTAPGQGGTAADGTGVDRLEETGAAGVPVLVGLGALLLAAGGILLIAHRRGRKA